MACQRILNAIAENVSNDPAARPYVMVGLCFGLCQGGGCPEWSGDGCLRLGLSGGAFADWLCDRRNWCAVWTELHGRDH